MKPNQGTTGREIRKGESPDPVDVHVGKRLQLRRNLINVSQEQLGKSLGVSFQQIQKYERGANRISTSTLYKIAKSLGVSFDWFVQEYRDDALAPRHGFSDNKQADLDDAPKSNSRLPDDVFERKETFDLLRAYYSIADAEERRDVYRVIKNMKK